MRWLLFIMLLVACSHPPCSATNCNGCCDDAGTCRGGTEATACGTGTCDDCQALCGSASCSCEQQACVLHTEPPPFDAGTPQTPRWVDDTGITASQLGILVNDDDPQSRLVAGYYAKARGIPADNVFHVRLGRDSSAAIGTFNEQRQAVLAQLDARDIQALAITWVWPFHVSCMSITSAFALGYDDAWCQPRCTETRKAPLFESHHPSDAGVRPAMMIAAVDVGRAIELIDRGVSADHTFPGGTGYLVRSGDTVRNIRWPDFQATAASWPMSTLALNYVDLTEDPSGSTVIQHQDGLLFYFTGLRFVPEIQSNTWRPGAVADHLTSYGGQVPESSTQMSALRWLEAGATASFGTVVEPCTWLEKFPQVSTLIDHYYRGEPVVEAYWRSVQEPGEGLFIGEPLARPFGLVSSVLDGGALTMRTTALEPGVSYVIQAADQEEGPWVDLDAGVSVSSRGVNAVSVVPDGHALYRLRKQVQ
ncbi:MAG: TIGR03790 family protein [Myxococcaceae bacterium]